MYSRKATLATAAAVFLVVAVLAAASTLAARNGKHQQQHQQQQGAGNASEGATQLDATASATATAALEAKKQQQQRMRPGRFFDETFVPPAAGKKPHVLFVLVDDLGWANVGFHRPYDADKAPQQQEFPTPTITALAGQGIVLDRHYVYPVCSPTRSSLLSGRLPVHVNVENRGFEHVNPADPVSGYDGIPRNMTTLGNKLRAAGYATHMVGKWAVGYASQDQTPVGRGFDSSLNYFHNANDLWTGVQINSEDENEENNLDLWNTQRPARQLVGSKYEEQLFLDRMSSVIAAHDPRTPLFLFYASRIAHTPLQVPQEYADRFAFINDSESRRSYAAMVSYLDDSIAALVQQLKQKGMWDDTLVIFSSDNGGPVSSESGSNNHPLRGGKAYFLEGGVRVSAFVSGGFLPQERRGTTETNYVHVCDWYSTLCALAGVDPTDAIAAAAGLPPVDSINLWPLLSGQSTEPPRTEVHLDTNALISGDYKLVVGGMPGFWQGPFYPNASTPDVVKQNLNCLKGCLFNIREDPTEHVDLAQAMPDKLRELQGRLRALNATFFNPFRGKVDPRAAVQARVNGGFWGPWLP